jgi:hypothetical protein
MPNDFNGKIKFAWEVLKVQLILNKKTRVFHYNLFFPYHRFVVNDGNNVALEKISIENKQTK